MILNCKTHYSILRSINRAETVAKRCEELGYDFCAITDIKTLAGVVQFSKECNKLDIKPILGIDIGDLLILSKNLAGWKKLVQICSAVNRPGETLDLSKYVDENLIGIMKDPYHLIFSDVDAAYLSPDPKSLASPNWSDCYLKWIQTYSELFPNNLYLGLTGNRFPAEELCTKAARWAGKKLGLKCVAVPPCYYPEKVDAFDHRTVLCIDLGIKLKEAIYRAPAEYIQYFNNSDYYLESCQKLDFEAEDLYVAMEIAQECEKYSIEKQQRTPKFDCPDSNEYLRELCREGWKRKIAKKIPKEKIEIYKNRIEHELETLIDAELADYFLIVQDLTNYAKRKGRLLGVARGCLTGDVPIYLSTGQTRPISEIRTGDFVITEGGRPHRVVNKFEYKIKETLTEIKCVFGDTASPLRLTGDHKVLCEKSVLTEEYKKALDKWKHKVKKYEEPVGALEWVQADSIQKGDWLFTPFPVIKTLDVSRFDLAEFCCKSNHRFDDNYVYHDQMNTLCNIVAKTNRVSRYLDLDGEWFYIFGKFVGDGWFRLDRSRSEIGFAFNSDDTTEIELVKKKFESIGCSTSTHKHKTAKLVQVNVQSYFIRRLFEYLHPRYRCTPETKHIPDFVLKSSDKNIESYISGYVSADGHIDTNDVVCTTVSKELAYQTKFLCLRLKQPCSIAVEHRKDKRVGFSNLQPSYTVTYPIQKYKKNLSNYRILSNGYLQRVVATRKFDYEGIVYDLQISCKSNYLTSSCLVHNSAGGCLTSYLLNITELDPIKHNLIFERFWNPARKGSLPDIDLDFPADMRDEIIEYIKNKYGTEYVASVITYQTFQGRSALTDVLRVHDACTFEEMKVITKPIPDKARIADELQNMREQGEDAKIIRWALENKPDQLREWAYLDDAGNVQGEFSKQFEQAMRLEGLKTTSSKHPAGVIIGTEKLSECCPMLMDKNSNEPICGLEYTDLESIGIVKIDVLAIRFLDKIEGVMKLVSTGKI